MTSQDLATRDRVVGDHGWLATTQMRRSGSFAAVGDNVTAALDAVHATLSDLGVSADDYTTETYTGAVAAARR